MTTDYSSKMASSDFNKSFINTKVGESCEQLISFHSGAATESDSSTTAGAHGSILDSPDSSTPLLLTFSFSDIFDALNVEIVWTDSVAKYVRNEIYEAGAAKEDAETTQLATTLCLQMANNLHTAFELSSSDELVSVHDAWLVHDVLLQGHIYKTRDCLLFASFVPQKLLTSGNSDLLTCSGYENSASAVHRGPLALIPSGEAEDSEPRRFMAVLKPKTLTIFDAFSSTATNSCCFPKVVIDIELCVRAEILDADNNAATEYKTNDHLQDQTLEFEGHMSKAATFTDYKAATIETGAAWFRIVTRDGKAHKLLADSAHSAQRWCQWIEKSIFTLRNVNENGHVLIKIPFADIHSHSNDKEGSFSFIRLEHGTKHRSNFMLPSENLYTQICESLAGLKPLDKDVAKVEISTITTNARDLTIQDIVHASDANPTSDFAQTGFGIKELARAIVDAKDDANKLLQVQQKLKLWLKINDKSTVTSGETTIAPQAAVEPIHYTPMLADNAYHVEGSHATASEFYDGFSISRRRALLASYPAKLAEDASTGRVYVATGVVCFKRDSIRMILAVEDIVSCDAQEDNLTFKVKDGQDISFTFESRVVCDDCSKIINAQLTNDAISNQNRDAILLTPDYARENIKPCEQQQLIDNGRQQMSEDSLRRSHGITLPLMLEEQILPSRRPLNFVFITIGSRGDVQPYIALGKALMKEGHRVTIATHEEYEVFITKHGISFKLIAGNPTLMMHMMVAFGHTPLAFMNVSGADAYEWLKEVLRNTWDACQGADIIIESPSAKGGIHVAEALGVPYMCAFTMPWTRTHAYPHAMVVPHKPMGETYNYLSHVVFENLFWNASAPVINEWRTTLLKIPEISLAQLAPSKTPFLYNVSPTILAPVAENCDWVDVTGYWFLNEGSAGFEPAPELLEFMQRARSAKKPLVYIGFGSIVVQDADSLFKAVLEGVADADVYCILNKGWLGRLNQEPSPEYELPPQVFETGAVPHDWLFKHIDAAVHHGGSGTTGACVRLGIPSIIKPFFGDQFFYIDLLEKLGIGIRVDNLDRQSLSQALIKATSDLEMKHESRKVSEKVQSQDGVSRAIASIYNQFDYSKSLIEAKRARHA